MRFGCLDPNRSDQCSEGLIILIHSVVNSFGHPLAPEYVTIAAGTEYSGSVSTGFILIAFVGLLGVIIHRWRLKKSALSNDRDVDHQPYVHYSAGAMLLDLEDPRKILYRSAEPTLAPETDEERAGVVPNVVFPTGIDPRANGRVDVYYGMADSAIGVARLDIPAQF